MLGQEPRPPPLKFNDLFNQHFPWLIFLKSILCVKTGEVEVNCNCNYILFTKLPLPGDSEGTFRSSSQAATCLPVYHTWRRLNTIPFNAERQAGKL